MMSSGSAALLTEKRTESMKQTAKVNEQLFKVVSPLLQWYDSHARILPWRENPEPYAVWISEIMLQQTRVEAVKPYFDRWMKAYPDLSSLAGADEEEVLKLWEGLGYYSRVRNIHKAARLVMKNHGGSLPPSFSGLLRLPGIGEYTAGAIGSIAFRLPVPCVDGNVLRVVARLTAEKADVSTAAAKKQFTEWVAAIIPTERPGDFNQAMMELGATVCLPNGFPKCELCPVSFLCEARLQNCVTEFPVKSARPARKVEKRTVLVLLDETGSVLKTALRRRPDRGLLAGLWEFPNVEGELSAEEVSQILHSAGLTSPALVKLKKAKHIFTHIQWEMTGYLAVVDHAASLPGASEKADSDLHWVGIDQLETKLALPAAFKPYYQNIKCFINKELRYESN
ncbi:MAG: A/G-specific adenine glycosylase [Eubacteriales bacterium]|nr:A/G-specific adenine glycosylase [Eubacteriales bacterium]